MGSLALLARDLGMKVTGCDLNVYPPMSDQLNNADIKLIEGFNNDQLKIKPDLWVIGNIATRTFPIIESILDEKLTYMSGPSFLSNYILKNYDVVAISGTHGKTTVSSLLAWILEFSNYNPGYLIGGLPLNFKKSARNGKKGGVFILEADEYDSAFFDKRSKFLHYSPKVAVINNLEFDHADIFADLRAVEDQFHHWIKTIPSKSKIFINKNEPVLVKLLERGIWSDFQFFNEEGSWGYKDLKNYKNSEEFLEKFVICDDKQNEIEVSSPLIGDHNKSNLVAAATTANFIGVPLEQTVEAIENFKGIKRRMELRGEVGGVKVFDDFAHHPTAIKTTISGIKRQFINNKRSIKSKRNTKVVVVFEPRSNSMKIGAMRDKLSESFEEADQLFIFSGGINWDIRNVFFGLNIQPKFHNNFDVLINDIVAYATSGDIILIMSNGGFGGIHKKILNKLSG